MEHRIGIVVFANLKGFVLLRPIGGGRLVIARRRDAGCAKIWRRMFQIVKGQAVDLPKIGERIIFRSKPIAGERYDRAVAWCPATEANARIYRRVRLERDLAPSGAIEELMLPDEVKWGSVFDRVPCRYNTGGGMEVEDDDRPFAFEDAGWDNGVLTPVLIVS